MDPLAPPLPNSRVEIVDGVEQLVIRCPGSRVVIVFFAIWIVGWAAGSAAGIYALPLADFAAALVIFLTFWLVSGLVVIALLSWQLAGEEVIRVDLDRLVHAVRAPGWRRQHVYPIGEVRAVSSDAGPPPFDRRQQDNPPLRFGLSGMVKFQFRGRTVRMGKGQNETEGRAILAWLASRLPRDALAATP